MNETGRSVATPPPGIPSLAVRAPAAHLGVAVVRELTDVIVTGVLKPGGLLPPEASLTAQFGVSRTVIRESIKRIEEKGLVTVTQGLGTRVSDPTEWNLLDPVVLSSMIDNDDALGILDEVSRVRATLEATMAGDAAEKATESQISNLRDALDDMRESLDDPDEFTIADRRFHNLVMRYSGNRLAPSMARTLFNRALESRRYHGVDPDNALELTTEAHQRIFNAIQSRDREAASRAMFDHIEGSWQARRLPSGETAS
jgi:GntR family transcriptional regulator, galactonate operon transcriptional repressor